MPSVLIVDDLPAIHEMLEAVIQPTGYETSFALNGEEALEKYKADPTDVVLADISMEPMDGISLLQNLKSFDPGCVVILMTGYASTETAMKALKYGAFDYIQKPFKIDELLQTLKRAMEMPRNRGRLGEPAIDPADNRKIASQFLGKSPKISQLRKQAVKMIPGRAPLLLHGEFGTGKRILAELIHEGGEVDGPLIVVDCGLREESELIAGLGSEDGGGDLLARAKDGTLLFENIDRLSREGQQVLGRVVKQTVDTRIICTTEVDLEKMVDEGRFDDELFYRIAALPIYLPPLRECLEDLPELVKHFTQKARNASFEPGQIEFADDAIGVMRGYRWPGNFTELAQTVSSLASETEKRVVTAAMLPEKFTSIEEWPSLEEHLERKRKAYIRKILRVCGGDVEKAAQILDCDTDELVAIFVIT